MIVNLIISAIILLLTGFLALLAKFAPELISEHYFAFSQRILAAVARFTDILPVALWEFLAALLFLLLLLTFFRMAKKHTGFFRWLSGVVLAVSVLLFVFTGMWGLGHFGPSVAERIGLPVREYTRQELIDATRYYAAQAGALADEVERDANGCAVFSDFDTLSKHAQDGFPALAERYEALSGSVGPVKKLLAWPLYSRFGITGIFVCYTAESTVNPDTYAAWLPVTMCHELAHRQAVTAEDEANFVACLACMENDDVQFRYSGAFAAYIYCSNALFDADSGKAAEIWNDTHPGVRADAEAANAHYEQYEGVVQDVATKVNDIYLKAFNEAEGVQSYGKAADLLIAWYLQNA